MQQERGMLRVVLAAALIGSLTALAVPASPLRAVSEACKCDDDGYGRYKCNAEQTQCIAGGQMCSLVCAT